MPIGDTSTIRHAPYGTVSRFYADWYRPELMAVLVVGDVDPDQIEARLKASFGSWTAPSPARPKAPATIAPNEGTFVKVLTDPEATQTRIQVIYKHPKALTASVRTGSGTPITAARPTAGCFIKHSSISPGPIR